jgi:TolB-like protein
MEDEDVFGDGVNIASRLEPLAPAGGIYVTESVYRNIQNKKGIKAVYVGEETLKNVDHPIRIYEVDAQASEVVTPDAPNEVNAPEVKIRSIRWIKQVFIIPFIIIVIVVAYLVYNNLGKGEDTTEIAEQENREKSIAVLPFVNMSDDPSQEYFSDGMMEEILNQLVQIEGLIIPSRTTLMRYKGSPKSVPEIGEELGVAYVLEGSVRKHGNKVRITVQLIDVSHDRHLWSNNYDRNLDDIFAIQSDVAEQIAGYLKTEIKPEVMSRIELKLTDNSEVIDLYLLGKSLKNTDPEKAEQIFEQVIALDSSYVPAYAEMGDLWLSKGIFNGYLHAEEVVKNSLPFLNKALMLNYDYPATHIYLAGLKQLYEWDWKTAGREYRIAQQLNPANLDQRYILFLLQQGKFEEAMDQTNQKYAIDPSAFKLVRGLCHFFLDEKVKAKYISTELLKGEFFEVFGIARLALYLELYDEVIKKTEKWRLENPTSQYPVIYGNLGIAYYHVGQPDKVDDMLQELKKKSKDSPIGSPAYFAAMIYAQMGEIDTAFEWLDKAYEDHEVEMIWLKVEPPFDPIRSDPRWQAMLNKVGFPDQQTENS